MTFSIVARDPRTLEFGVACATGGPVVGSLVPHVRGGIGAIATQGHTTNPFYAVDGLGLLESGLAAAEVVEALTAADHGRAHRQLLVLDASGATATFTGERCAQHAGHRNGPDVAVAGNLLARPVVLDAMLEAYLAKPDQPIADRLIAALAAGLAQGGDIRGVRSAAVRTSTREPYPAVDLRADWSMTPIEDLKEVLAAVRTGDYADFFSRLPTTADRHRA